MKQEVVLRKLYYDIFEKEFNYNNFEDRMIMQKTMYIIQKMGFDIGGYSFFWYKHGPYSQALQEDCYSARHEMHNTELTLTSNGKKAVDKIKNIVKNKPDAYRLSNWLEAIASLKYLKDENEINGDDNLISELQKRKSHLSDYVSNKEALKIVNSNI